MELRYNYGVNGFAKSKTYQEKFVEIGDNHHNQLIINVIITSSVFMENIRGGHTYDQYLYKLYVYVTNNKHKHEFWFL